jgi:hypothetical protein
MLRHYYQAIMIVFVKLCRRNIFRFAEEGLRYSINAVLDWGGRAGQITTRLLLLVFTNYRQCVQGIFLLSVFLRAFFAGVFLPGDFCGWDFFARGYGVGAGEKVNDGAAWCYAGIHQGGPWVIIGNEIKSARTNCYRS